MTPAAVAAERENAIRRRHAQNKRAMTAKARAALRCIELHNIEGDDGRVHFIATMHALTRSFDSLADVESWQDGIGAPR